MTDNACKLLPLGEQSSYTEHYEPKLLYPIIRQDKREELGITGKNLPFEGVDIWNAYEISWLNPQGMPQVAIASFFIPCQSSHLIESKSLKLYLNSFNQTPFDDRNEVEHTIQNDLSTATHSKVRVTLFGVEQIQAVPMKKTPGFCLDSLSVSTRHYEPRPDLLQVDTSIYQEETLYSHLLKSNCLVTQQPDWGSVWIHYHGPKIEHRSLLKYLISFRQHNEFHEQCVERIFMDITQRCQPENLTVYARYTRRGGLDINPFRSNFEAPYENYRSFRQ